MTTHISEGFWRDYWPLLLAVGAAQLTLQVDLVMVGRLGGEATGAYGLLMRLALIDVVSMTALSAVASTVVAQAQRVGEASVVIAQTLGLAALAGALCCILGLLFYPRFATWIGGECEATTLVGQAGFWYSLGAPFRFLANTGFFILHALGRGRSVVRWKLVEVAARVVGNFLIMDVCGLGFTGCFVTGLIIAVASTIWCRSILSSGNVKWFSVPRYSWALPILQSTAWESQRMASVQLALLTAVALFAAPWLGTRDVSRLNAYVAGQTFMLVIFAPFLALVRFLAFRMAAENDDRLAQSIRMIWTRGAPVVAVAALVMLAAYDELGRLYGQHGPWWSTLIQALALSLPIRFGATVMRAMLHSRGAFATVATADSGALWLLATPLVALGLSIDSPGIAYLSLLVPEAACVVWFWRCLGLGRIDALWRFDDYRLLPTTLREFAKVLSKGGH